MFFIRTNEELAMMRRAGQINALAHQAIAQALQEGISLIELDEIARYTIEKEGGIPALLGYEGYPNSICASVNNALVHGIPNKYKLKCGDIVTIDITSCYNGYYGDSAVTYGIGNLTSEAKQLIQVTRQALTEGLTMVKPNNRLGDVSHAIQTYVEAFHYSLPNTYGGHGIGRELHEDPMVLNVGEPHTGIILEKGMCLAIEPMAMIGRPHTRVLEDGWTVVSKDHRLNAHFEHTVVITDEGYEILTALPNFKEDYGNG